MMLPKRAVNFIATVGVLLGAAAGAGFAQTDEELADYSRRGPYMGLFFVWGKEAFDVSDVESSIETDLEAARSSAGECDPTQGIACNTSTLVDRGDGFGGALRAGYRFSSLLAAELDLQGLQGFDIDRDLYVPAPGFENNPQIAAANPRIDADVNLYTAMVNGKLYPLEGQIQPYVLGGVGIVVADVDSKAGASGKESDVTPLFGGRIGGGIDYYLTRNWVMNFDISYTLTTQDVSLKYGNPKRSEDISVTHVPISAGLIYRFGAPPAAPAPPAPPPAPAAAVAAAPIKKKIVLRGVNFDFDKSDIRADARPVLDEAASTLKEEGQIRITVQGHTDSRGTDAYNQTLSEQRANSVADYLEKGGIDRGRMEIEGFGESRPVASNDTDDGRAQNRRVELSVIP
jgi:OOP family OmpA-OmpF porin